MSRRKTSRNKLIETLTALAGMMTAQGFSADKIRPSFQTQRIAVPGAVIGADGSSHVVGMCMIEFNAIPCAEFNPDAAEMRRREAKLAALGFKPQGFDAGPTEPTAAQQIRDLPDDATVVVEAPLDVGQERGSAPTLAVMGGKEAKALLDSPRIQAAISTTPQRSHE